MAKFLSVPLSDSVRLRLVCTHCGGAVDRAAGRAAGKAAFSSLCLLCGQKVCAQDLIGALGAFASAFAALQAAGCLELVLPLDD